MTVETSAARTACTSTAEGDPTRSATGGAGDTSDRSRAHAVRTLESEMSELVARFRTVIRESAERLSPGLHPHAYKTFTMIEKHGPMTSSTLGELLNADKGLVSRTVRQLEKLNLIARTPDPEDGRCHLLSATDFGRDRLTEARGPRGGHLAETVNRWDVDDIERLAVLLHALGGGARPGSFADLESRTSADVTP